MNDLSDKLAWESNLFAHVMILYVELFVSSHLIISAEDKNTFGQQALFIQELPARGV